VSPGEQISVLAVSIDPSTPAGGTISVPSVAIGTSLGWPPPLSTIPLVTATSPKLPSLVTFPFFLEAELEQAATANKDKTQPSKTSDRISLSPKHAANE
jgi:hypothetical protein